MRYRVPDTVAWVVGEDIGSDNGVYIASILDGRPYVLRDTAQMIWLVAAEGGDLAVDVEVPDDQDAATVQAQVSDFAAHLVSLGLLEEVT